MTSIQAPLEKLMMKGPHALVWNTLAFTLLFGLLVLIVPSPVPYVSIQAKSELLRYRVARPLIAAVAVVDAQLSGLDVKCQQSQASDRLSGFTGLLKPAANAIVTYRFSPDLVAVSIDASNGSAGQIEFEDEADCALSESATVLIKVPPKQEAGNQPQTRQVALRPLPIAGPADVGEEFGVPTLPRPGRPVYSLMSEGTIKVSGRALLPPYRGSLYPLSDAEFTLPAGGRLSSGDPLVGSPPKPNVPPWFGLATVGETGFDISATTISSGLRLYRPGANSEAETFGLSLLGRFYSDPSIAFLSIWLAIFVAVFQVVNGWLSVLREPPES